MIEERVSGESYARAQVQYLFSPATGHLVLRDRDANASAGDGLEERFYAFTNPQGNVTAIGTAAGTVSERFFYGPEGNLWVTNGAWGEQLNGSAFAWNVLFRGGRWDNAMVYHIPGQGSWDYRTAGRIEVDRLQYWDNQLGYTSPSLSWIDRNAATILSVGVGLALAIPTGGVSLGALAIMGAGAGVAGGAAEAFAAGGSNGEIARAAVVQGAIEAVAWPGMVLGAGAVGAGLRLGGQMLLAHPRLAVAGAALAGSGMLSPQEADAAVPLGRLVGRLAASASRHLRLAERGERALMRQVSRLPDEVIIGKPGAMGTHGADVVSFNRQTGRVTLWDAKYRSAATRIQQSSTFRMQQGELSKPLVNALREARALVVQSTLTPAQQRQALRSLESTYLRKTVGFGNARNSAFQ